MWAKWTVQLQPTFNKLCSVTPRPQRNSDGGGFGVKTSRQPRTNPLFLPCFRPSLFLSSSTHEPPPRSSQRRHTPCIPGGTAWVCHPHVSLVRADWLHTLDSPITGVSTYFAWSDFLSGMCGRAQIGFAWLTCPSVSSFRTGQLERLHDSAELTFQKKDKTY